MPDLTKSTSAATSTGAELTPNISLGVQLNVDPYKLALWPLDRQRRYLRAVSQVIGVIAEDEPVLQVTG